MYFPDLTPYCYGSADVCDDVLNVGWLSKQHDFSRSAPDPRLVLALAMLIEHPVNRFRGDHHCEFCPYSGRGWGDPSLLGNGEIRVKGSAGITYVAPVLIYHYVVTHLYSPPKPFVDAVLSAASNLQNSNASACAPTAGVLAKTERT